MWALRSCRRLLLQLLMLQRVRRPGGVLRVVMRGVARGMVCKLRAALDGKLHLIPSACIINNNNNNNNNNNDNSSNKMAFQLMMS